MQNKKQIKVVAAIIKVGKEILCVQRPKHKKEYISKKFEFPGGKIEKGATRKPLSRTDEIYHVSPRTFLLQQEQIIFSPAETSHTGDTHVVPLPLHFPATAGAIFSFLQISCFPLPFIPFHHTFS